MRGWKKAALDGLLGLLLLISGAVAFAQAITISHLQVESTDEGWLLDARMQIDLPAAIEDALNRGVPMYFVTEATLLRERWYWSNRKLASASRHARLSYQPLTRRWRLQISSDAASSSGLAQSYDSLREALLALQRVSGWKFADPVAGGEAEGRLSVQFGFRLDVSQLPRPLQIGVVGQSDWNLSATRTVAVAADAGK